MKRIDETEIVANRVQNAPDVLEGTATENKAVFDKLPMLIIKRYNEMFEELAITADTMKKLQEIGYDTGLL